MIATMTQTTNEAKLMTLLEERNQLTAAKLKMDLKGRQVANVRLQEIRSELRDVATPRPFVDRGHAITTMRASILVLAKLVGAVQDIIENDSDENWDALEDAFEAATGGTQGEAKVTA